MSISSLLPITTAKPHTPDHQHPLRKEQQHRKYETEKREEEEEEERRRKKKKKKQQELQLRQQLQRQRQLPPSPKPPSSWKLFKSLLICRSVVPTQVHHPSYVPTTYEKLGSSCSAICSIKDVVHTNTRVVHRRDQGQSSDTMILHHAPETKLLLKARSSSSSSTTTTRSTGGRNHQSSRGMQLRKLSGCYECHAISHPTRYPIPRMICSCPQCGEVFTKSESLEHHQMSRHAVSELGPEDSGRNIVEIIFKSSWAKKEMIVDYQSTNGNNTRQFFCEIDRILKVQNTQRTINRFEEYRDTIKSRAALRCQESGNENGKSFVKKKNPRCAADGNELLRFHCTTLSCSLGANGSTSLCCGYSSTPPCGVCSIIRHGFVRARQDPGKGVRTTASSGRAHECLSPVVELGEEIGGRRRAMLVCRVIAGRVRKGGDVVDRMETDGVGVWYDSVGGGGSGNLEELFVTNPRAILPCFVVIYRTSK